MAGAKTGQKKTVGLRVRMLDGKRVIPCLYSGRAVGHGKYFAAMINDQLIVDETGKPYPFDAVGELVEQA